VEGGCVASDLWCAVIFVNRPYLVVLHFLLYTFLKRQGYFYYNVIINRVKNYKRKKTKEKRQKKNYQN